MWVIAAADYSAEKTLHGSSRKSSINNTIKYEAIVTN